MLTCGSCGRDFLPPRKHRKQKCCSYSCANRAKTPDQRGVRKPSSRAQDIARFWTFTIPEPNSGCILWLGKLSSNGYGHYFAQRRSCIAHRFAYEAAVGAIAPGLQIDHLCRTRCCVNPLHLEAVTPQVNTLRARKAA